MATRRSQEELDAHTAQWELERSEREAADAAYAIFDTEKYFKNSNGELTAWADVHAAKKLALDKAVAEAAKYKGMARNPRTGRPWKWGVPYPSTDGPRYQETHLPGKLLVLDWQNNYTKEYKVEHDPTTGIYTKRTFVRNWGVPGQTPEEDAEWDAMFLNLPKL